MPGGGLGRSVWAAARLLTEHAEVTILTSERHRAHHEKLRATGDTRLPEGVRFAFAAEPDEDSSPYASWFQGWAAALLEGVIELYPDGGPDVVEAPDYQGDGFAISHAIRSRDPRLRRTTLAVRLHTSAEICAALDERADDIHLQVVRGMERFPLAYADVLLEPGGDVMERYRRYYGAERLAPSIYCPPPVTTDTMPSAGGHPLPRADGPLRILYLNRLQRLKGIEDLLAAVAAIDSDDFRLTVVGGDTDTGPGGSSMRRYVERMTDGDGRVRFAERVPYEEIGELISDHHLVVVPSRWEAFSYVVREALACNRPVLATPVGPIPDVVELGRSGWLARSGSVDDLRRALAEAIADRDEIDRMIEKGLPRQVLEANTNEDVIVERYRGLLGVAGRRPRASRSSTDGIAAVVAGEPDGPPLAPTLRSLARQRGVAVEATVVGLEPEPSDLPLVARVVAPPNDRTDRIALWAAGAREATGGLLLLLPAGAELESDFAARAVAALEEGHAFAYATAFVRHGREVWHAPAGNFELPVQLDLGASVAMVRRSALAEALAGDDCPPDEASLFAALAKQGHFGVVLHEPLVTRLPRRSGAGHVVT